VDFRRRIAEGRPASIESSPNPPEGNANAEAAADRVCPRDRAVPVGMGPRLVSRRPGTIRLFESSQFDVEPVHSDGKRWLKFLIDAETLDPIRLPAWMLPPS